MKQSLFFTTIDRYFMRKFLFVASALLFIAASLFMIFDILQNVEEINDLFNEFQWGALLILFQFYSVRMMNLMLYTQFAFVCAVTAVTFFILEKNSNAMVRGGEVIPMLTSGFSRKRVAIPFFFIGSVFILLLCTVEEVFYARCRDWPGAMSKDYTGEIGIQEMNLSSDLATGIKIYGSGLDLESNTIQNPKFGIPKNRTLYQLDEIRAKAAVWLPDANGRPSGYLLKNIRNLENKIWLSKAAQTECQIPGIPNPVPIFFTSRTAPWVSEGELFIVSLLPPKKLLKKDPGFLPRSIPQLYQDMHEKGQQGANYAVRAAFHCRIVRPLAEIILLFLLIPVILSARIRSKLFIFSCILGLMGLNIGLIEIGRLLVIQDGVPAAIGAWFPILILSPICAILFDELYT